MTYTIRWRRPGETEILECRGLSPRVLVARLMSALRNQSWVEVRAVVPDSKAHRGAPPEEGR